MSKKRKRPKRVYHWPYGIGLDKRQARRLRRRVAKQVKP